MINLKINIGLIMVLIFEVPTCAIFNIIENDFFSIQGLKFFNIGSSGKSIAKKAALYGPGLRIGGYTLLTYVRGL